MPQLFGCQKSHVSTTRIPRNLCHMSGQLAHLGVDYVQGVVLHHQASFEACEPFAVQVLLRGAAGNSHERSSHRCLLKTSFFQVLISKSPNRIRRNLQNMDVCQ